MQRLWRDRKDIPSLFPRNLADLFKILPYPGSPYQSFLLSRFLLDSPSAFGYTKFAESVKSQRNRQISAEVERALVALPDFKTADHSGNSN
jgi:hypothetical protein